MGKKRKLKDNAPDLVQQIIKDKKAVIKELKDKLKKLPKKGAKNGEP